MQGLLGTVHARRAVIAAIMMPIMKVSSQKLKQRLAAVKAKRNGSMQLTWMLRMHPAAAVTKALVTPKGSQQSADAAASYDCEDKARRQYAADMHPVTAGTVTKTCNN